MCERQVYMQSFFHVQIYVITRDNAKTRFQHDQHLFKDLRYVSKTNNMSKKPYKKI